MSQTTDAQLLFLPDSESLRFLPEGPTALGSGRFSWVAIQHGADAQNGSLNIFDVASGTNQQYALPGRPGFAKPTNRSDTFVVGCERELGLFNTESRQWQSIASGIDADRDGTIINDGTVYADNLVFGTKDLEFKTPKAGLYLFRASDQQLIRLRDDQVCSNGKDVMDSGDGGLHLIDIDSPTKKVVRYRLNLDGGELSECETIVDLNDLPSVPDGMTLTPDEQSMIISFYNPNPAEFGETRQYSLLNGQLEHIWRTPQSPQNTCPLLLEMPDGSVKLIITTAVEHMPSERRQDAKLAGGLFVAETSFATSPATPMFPIDRFL
ncbi:SMP-30/gluconolactonase/LRE family protein [Aureliella helgolandensis]|uniref:SMP-30/Gluconolaconase/LRE-like region n=1 Tax=Aureliella helgolandensis TaxID=2527968 RepID=A0A518G5C0_9BACT|nr:SMP-30/gluconolactonase/LRE family protein [Aureliella helgolandensis]QDV23797.1 SMP-30/Gluconolaconase/LRE-like region [Aureliella helgolandensis]